MDISYLDEEVTSFISVLLLLLIAAVVNCDGVTWFYDSGFTILGSANCDLDIEILRKLVPEENESNQY